MTITISNQINLSSSSASIKNGSNNSVMIFNIPVIKKEQNILYNQVSLINAQIPVSYYTINESNNLLVLSTGSFTLISGNYNATSFKTMLLTLLGVSYTMSLDNSTGKYTLSKIGGFTIMPTTTCYKILGIEKNVTYVSSGTLIFPYPCNFLGINRLKIKSSVFKTNNLDSNSNGHSDLLATIPVNVSQYSLITYNNLVNFKNIIYNEDVNFIDITITDETDTIVNFNGIDVHLTIQIDSIIDDFENKNSLQELLKFQNNNLV
jgi:hypothetical protein